MLVLLGLALFLAPACSTLVRPPAASGDDVTVYIADYGRHSSLVFPRAPGRLVEYAYGHWEWFALSRDDLSRGPWTLLVPGQGTLARRELDDPGDAAGLAWRLELEEVFAVGVPRARAAETLAFLDARFEAHRATLVHNARFGKDFVHDPDRYSIFHHCNHATADWLRRMGVEVGTVSLSADFTLRPPPRAPVPTGLPRPSPAEPPPR